MEPVSAGDLDWTEYERGDARFRRKKLAAAAGPEDLGCSLYELPAGARSWPYHYHTGNAEALYVLAGTGQVRTPDGPVDVAAGDYLPFPASAEGAHRVVNDGDEPLRYLALSTMAEPDVTVYPDSEKVGVFAGGAPGSDDERSVHGYYREADAVDYWEGEGDER